MHSFTTLFETYRYAWAAAGLIGLMCSIIAVYVVLRRVTFVGVATAQIAAAGVALAFLIDGPPMPFAAAATACGVALFSFGRESNRISREALVGIAYATASAFAVLCVFRSSQELDHIEHIVYGSLLFATKAQVWWLALGAIVVTVLHTCFAKEFVLVSFDPDTAHTLGVRTRLFQCLLAATLALAIALSIGTAGSLLTFTLLVLPAATALLLSDRLARVFALSVATGLAATLGGLSAAVIHDSPPGPTIVSAGALLLSCAALARIRGWLGAIALAGIVSWTFCGPPATSSLEAAPNAPALPAASDVRVELEITALTPVVRRGERARFAAHAHTHGNAPPTLHVLIELGTNQGAALLPADGGDVIIELVADVVPGPKQRVVATAWSGPPFEPDDTTRPLDGEECRAASTMIEVVP